MNKKLEDQIEKKLDRLSKLLDNTTEAQVIDSNDPDTWDSDTLYNLVAHLKEALQLLEDQKITRRNEFGETITWVETGLCSLMDDYQEKEENYE